MGTLKVFIAVQR